MTGDDLMHATIQNEVMVIEWNGILQVSEGRQGMLSGKEAANRKAVRYGVTLPCSILSVEGLAQLTEIRVYLREKGGRACLFLIDL